MRCGGVSARLGPCFFFGYPSGSTHTAAPHARTSTSQHFLAWSFPPHVPEGRYFSKTRVLKSVIRSKCVVLTEPKHWLLHFFPFFNSRQLGSGVAPRFHPTSLPERGHLQVRWLLPRLYRGDTLPKHPNFKILVFSPGRQFFTVELLLNPSLPARGPSGGTVPAAGAVPRPAVRPVPRPTPRAVSPPPLRVPRDAVPSPTHTAHAG